MCVLKTLNGECSLDHEICQNGACTCEPNYKYSENRDRCEANFCDKTSTCPEKSKCEDVGDGTVRCICDEGFFMSGGKCVETNKCIPGACDQLCEDGVCSCAPGFSIKDEKKCEREDPSSKCKLNCAPGECYIDPKDKEEKCACPSSSHVAINKTCTDLCTAVQLPKNVCPTGDCLPLLSNGFRCVCKGPYKLADDKIHCERKVMCQERAAIEECRKASAYCVEKLDDMEKGYQCMCQPGYGMENGVCKRNCERKKCEKTNEICELDERFEAVCKCPPPLTRVDKDDPESECAKMAEFSYLGHLSILKTKYEAKAPRRSRREVSSQIDLLKLRRDLEKSMKNVYGDLNDMKILRCNIVGEALNCSLEIQPEHEQENVNAIAARTTCLPINQKYCLVKPDLILERKSTENAFAQTNPCGPESASRLCDKSQDCKSEDNRNYQCECKTGYTKLPGRFYPLIDSRKTYIERCKEINECENPVAVCPQTTDCINKPGGFDCRCKPGYQEKPGFNIKKDGCVGLCDPNPCNNGTCQIIGALISCKCLEDFTGMYCNETVKVTTVTKTNIVADTKTAAIVGGVLGTLLVLALIAAIFIYRRWSILKVDNEQYARLSQQSTLAHMTQFPGLDRGTRDPERDLEPRSGGGQRRPPAERVIPRARLTRTRDEASPGTSGERQPGRRQQYQNRGYAGDDGE